LHTDVHTSLDSTGSFPHPDQVLSRIHTQQAQLLLSAAHQLPVSVSAASAHKHGKAGGAAITTSANTRTLPASSTAGAQNFSSELFNFKDFSGGKSRARPSPQPGPSSSSTPTLSSTPLAVASNKSSTAAAAQQAAEALQQAQQQQQVQLLQSALFGSQFTALPRVSLLFFFHCSCLGFCIDDYLPVYLWYLCCSFALNYV
jgi:hypothetical protein